VKIIDPNAINPIMNPLNQSDPNLHITYINEPISSLSSTYITFWNAGNIKINEDDIPKRMPITVKVKDGIRIFRLTILKAKDENSFQVIPLLAPSTSSPLLGYNFSFEYLAKNEGIKFQIIHSGTSNEDIIFNGKTKEDGFFKDISKYKEKREKYFSILTILVSIFIVFFGIGVLVLATPILVSTNNNFLILLGIEVALFIVIVFGLTYLLAKATRHGLNYFFPQIPLDLK